MKHDHASPMNEIEPGLWIGSLAALRHLEETTSWTIITLLDNPKLVRLAKALVLSFVLESEPELLV